MELLLFVIELVLELGCAMLIGLTVAGLFIAGDKHQKDSEKRYREYKKKKEGDL